MAKYDGNKFEAKLIYGSNGIRIEQLLSRGRGIQCIHSQLTPLLFKIAVIFAWQDCITHAELLTLPSYSYINLHMYR